jgi:hypothetical protein
VVNPLAANIPTILTITATAPGTTAKLQLSASADVIAGTGVSAATAGGTVNLSFTSAGDVVQLVSSPGANADFSGSILQADKPVQVITSVPCIDLPSNVVACDHVEESVLPAETLGKHYVVANPTGATGNPGGQVVRFYGNRDATTLTYVPKVPKGCPTTLTAGQVVDCGVVGESFEVTSDQEFAVMTFLLGASAYDDSNGRGDPSETAQVAVEQYREKYVFLAPDDYPVLWGDVVGPADANVVLDGTPVTAKWAKIGSGEFGIFRVDLTKSGNGGAHVLVADKPVSLQVLGYGDYTSFQYPGGLNLGQIAPPPQIR